MKLSVVVPVYNEKKRITKTIEESLQYFRKNEPDFELILVNDGSNDSTLEIIQRFAKNNAEIKIVSYHPNHGKGYAIQQGLQKAQGDLALFMDADLSTPLHEYKLLKDNLNAGKLDFVIGSRVKDESDIEIKQPLYRRFVGRIFNLLVRIIALPGIKDSQCGFKLFTRKTYRLLIQKQTIFGFSFDVEYLYIARKNDLKFKEIGVKWSNDFNTRVSVLSSAPTMLINLFKIKWRHR
ncbi:dolichyl-phosphate beta-glucosyltransferase [Candidatus Margulisiibacteriota bacterium]